MTDQKQDWLKWKEDIWKQITRICGTVIYEQIAIRSSSEKRCFDCGAPGVVKVDAGEHFQHVVEHYWMCQNCYDFWQQEKEKELTRREDCEPKSSM